MVILTIIIMGFVISLTMYKNSNFWSIKLFESWYKASFPRWTRIYHQKYTPTPSKLRKLRPKPRFYENYGDDTCMVITFQPNGIWNPFN